MTSYNGVSDPPFLGVSWTEESAAYLLKTEFCGLHMLQYLDKRANLVTKAVKMKNQADIYRLCVFLVAVCPMASSVEWCKSCCTSIKQGQNNFVIIYVIECMLLYKQDKSGYN